MTLEAAIQFFTTEVEQSKDKRILPLCRSFLSLLLDLQSKELTNTQKDKIDEKLSIIRIDKAVENRKKYLSKALSSFKIFLKDTFSFVSKGYYTGLFMSLGISVGMTLGISFGIPFGMPLGMVFGMMIGMGIGLLVGIILGTAKDAIAAKEDRIITSSTT